MKKQTAVQYIEDNYSLGKTIGEMKIILATAKEMEKQQIENAWENGYTHGASANDEPSIYHGTQYYKNTYEKTR